MYKYEDKAEARKTMYVFLLAVAIGIPSCYFHSKDYDKKQQLRKNPEYQLYESWVRSKGARFDSMQNPPPSFNEWKYLRNQNMLD